MYILLVDIGVNIIKYMSGGQSNLLDLMPCTVVRVVRLVPYRFMKVLCNERPRRSQTQLAELWNEGELLKTETHLS